MTSPHCPRLTILNVTYDFAHLDPVTFQTPSQKLGRDIATWCRFTTHTFSRSPEAGEAADLVDEGRRPRVFCPERHHLSLHLPAAVAQLADPTRHVWEAASERNWLHQVEVEVVKAGARTAYLGRGSNTGYSWSRVDASRTADGTLTFSGAVRDGSMCWRSGEAARG